MPQNPEQPREPLMEQLKPTGNPDLVTLRQEVETGLRANLDRLVGYCQNNSINFADWKNFDGKDALQYDQIQEVLTLLGAQRLLGFLDPNNTSVSTEQREEALDILHNIAGLMERRTAVLDYTRSQHQAASESASSDTAGKAFEHVRELAGKHPLATIVSGLIALWGASALWNETFGPKNKPWFKYLGIAAGVAWASNKLSPIFLDGRYLTDIIRMDSKQVEGLMDEAEKRLKGTPIDKEAFRAMLTMGEIPLSVFLDAYERALNNASTEIDMKKFRIAARGTPAGRKIDDRFFDKRLGAPLFLEMQRLVGSRNPVDVERMRERYCTKEIDFNMRQALLAEYDPASDDAAQIADATKSWLTVFVGTAEAAEGLAERRRKYDMELSKELRDISEFKNSDIWILKSRDLAKVRGVHFKYERKEDPNHPGQFTYTFRLGSNAFSFSVGSLDADQQADRRTAIDQMHQAIEKSVADAVRNAGFSGLSTPPAVQWNPTTERWSLKTPYKPLIMGMGYPVSTKHLDLTLDEDNRLGFDFQGYTGGSLLTAEELDSALVEEYIKGELLKIPEVTLALGEMPIEITHYDPYVAPGIVNITAQAQGLELKCSIKNGGPLTVDFITLDSSFAEARAELSYPAFDAMFDQLSVVYRNLSNWRIVSDILSGDINNADDFSYYWRELVGLKRDQIRADYKARLMALVVGGSSVTVTPTILHNAYAQSIGKAERELATLAHDLLTANNNRDMSEYKRLVSEFYHYGFTSPEYQRLYDGFFSGRSFERFDFAGSEGQSARAYQRLRFLSERSLLHYTMRFKDKQVLTQAERDYFTYVQDAIFDLLQTLEIKDSTRWEYWINSAISEEEYIQLYPQLFELNSYEDWLASPAGQRSSSIARSTQASATSAFEADTVNASNLSAQKRTLREELDIILNNEFSYIQGNASRVVTAKSILDDEIDRIVDALQEGDNISTKKEDFRAITRAVLMDNDL